MNPDLWAVVVCLAGAGVLLFGAVVDSVVNRKRR